MENEKKAKEDLEKLKEEIRAERASVQAARVIEKQKREVGINRQVDMFNQSQEAVNQRVDSLVTAMGGLSKVQVVIDGVTQGTKYKKAVHFIFIFILISFSQLGRCGGLMISCALDSGSSGLGLSPAGSGAMHCVLVLNS